MNILSKYKNAKISNLKLILALKSIKNKKLLNILDILKFSNKKSFGFIRKTLISAINNAKNNFGLNLNNLKILSIIIDKGRTYKKIIPRAKGRFNYIKKRTSHITVILKKK